DVEADGISRTRRFAEHDVAGAAREIEDTIARRQRRERDESFLPAPIHSTGQEDRDEVVAIGDRREQRSNVALLAGGRGDGRSQPHARSTAAGSGRGESGSSRGAAPCSPWCRGRDRSGTGGRASTSRAGRRRVPPTDESTGRQDRPSPARTRP